MCYVEACVVVAHVFTVDETNFFYSMKIQNNPCKNGLEWFTGAHSKDKIYLAMHCYQFPLPDESMLTINNKKFQLHLVEVQVIFTRCFI